MKTQTPCLTTLFAILCAAMVLPTDAAPLRLKVLVRTNDPAPGVANGSFSHAPPNVGSDFQFGPPVAAGGHVAFYGHVIVRDANGNQVAGGGPGIWGGSQDGGLARIMIRRQLTPPLGSNIHSGFMNVSESGKIAFYARSSRGDGLWSSDTAGSSLGLVQQTLFGAEQRPLQTGSYVAFDSFGTNWIFNTDTRELRAVSYRGAPADVYGPSMTLSNSGAIVALTTEGQLLLHGRTSDGTNRLFLINNLGVITPVMSQGEPAPGIPNRRIGLMSVSGNDRGYVAVAVGRLDDGDANFANDHSALFAGPATNLSLLARSSPGVLWGGGTFITRSNHVYGANPSTTGLGIYKLPASTHETLTFTPLPPLPFPPRGGDLAFGSLNALGQYAVLYASSTHLNRRNQGLDLWFYNPGDGWTNVARAGSNLVVGAESIRVDSIGFVGNVNQPALTPTGAGHGTGLTDDGKLYFSVGTHLLVGDSAPRLTARLVALEVNQAVQDWNNSVLLVENKRTFVRAFVEAPVGASEPVLIKRARLRGFRGAFELPGSPLAPLNPGGVLLATTNAAARRHDLSESLRFQLPTSWLSGTVELRFEWPDGELTYADPAEPGGVPADGIVRAMFQRGGRPEVKWVLITHTNEVGEAVTATADDTRELEDRLEAIYPIDQLQLRGYSRVGFWQWPRTNLPTTPNDHQSINRALERLRRTERRTETNAPGPFRLSAAPFYYGVLRGNLGGGSANVSGSVASGWLPADEFDYARNLHAHELGHLLGRPHAVDSALGLSTNGTKQGYCDERASSATPDFPFFHSFYGGKKPTLGPMDQGPIPMAWGLDAHRQLGSVPRVVNPTNTYELMGYCNSPPSAWKWVSTYTYTNLFHAITNRFPPSTSGSPFLAGGDPPADYLLVSGAIDRVANTAALDPIIAMQLSEPPPAEPPGEYILRLRNAGGVVLSDTPFAPSVSEADAPEIGESTLATFVISVAADPAIRRMEILHGGQVIGRIESSANAPSVTVLSPNGGEVLANDPVVLRWDGNDLDGDALTYLVQYSADGGATWETLTVDWPQETFTVPRSALRGTEQGRIRIRASDGFNTAVDDSDNNFTVANHAPELAVLAPADNELVVGDQYLLLEADARDSEDGRVPDDRVQWTSSIGGVLGTGQTLALKAQSLAEGNHSIRVSATDAHGSTVSRTFRLRVQREAIASLQIERAGEAVRIAWPAALVDFVLESSPDLQPGSWSMVSQDTEFTAGMSVTTLPAPGSQQFFRLRKL